MLVTSGTLPHSDVRHPGGHWDAVIKLRGVEQQPREHELNFAAYVNDVSYRCGCFYDETEKMTFFINVLSSSTQPIVARYLESRPRPKITYKELVQYDQDEEEALFARTAHLRTRHPTRPTPASD